MDAHIADVLARLRGYLAAAGLSGVVLGRAGNVAWASAGINPMIDRSAEVESMWIVVTATRSHLITNVVEAPRLLEEHPVEMAHFDLVTVPWYGSDEYISVAVHLAGAEPAQVASDLGQPFGIDCTTHVVGLRMTHTELGQTRLRALGGDTVSALEDSLAGFEAGSTDLEVQAGLVFELERRGITPSVVIVGGDDRVRRFRHPSASGRAVKDLLMNVVVGRRQGLHIAVTRTVSVGTLGSLDRERYLALSRIQSAVLVATQTAGRYGELYRSLDDAYSREGHPKAWSEHFQGGPIGYQQREFEIAPIQSDSPWFDAPVIAGQAIAFNPSLAGGCKLEDSFLIAPGGPINLTPPLSWPTLALPGGGVIAGVLEL